jgi:hypothetical protein
MTPALTRWQWCRVTDPLTSPDDRRVDAHDHIAGDGAGAESRREHAHRTVESRS